MAFEGEILLNLDTEEDDEIDIGCGGVDVTATRTYNEEETPEGSGWLYHYSERFTRRSLGNGYSQRIRKCKQNHEPFVI